MDCLMSAVFAKGSGVDMGTVMGCGWSRGSIVELGNEEDS
jgi:hypothetical protein